MLTSEHAVYLDQFDQIVSLLLLSFAVFLFLFCLCQSLKTEVSIKIWII